jgi:ribosomal protein S18 acetylase RimI-like enzyme
MQRSWRTDADKLTFIVCLPVRPSGTGHDSGRSNNDTNDDNSSMTITEQDDTPDRMLGDVNLFLSFDDDDDDDDDNNDHNDNENNNNATPKIIGEIELMIAEKQNQRRGYGRAALLSFLQYILDHEAGIVEEFLLSQHRHPDQHQHQHQTALSRERRLSYLRVKINQSNIRSLKLFESLGFRKVSSEPNYFGEFELRRSRSRTGMDRDEISAFSRKFGIGGYRELGYYARE